jgi:peptidoglycan/xylan/chitin deacetylase (PgdA/CDA1 family)
MDDARDRRAVSTIFRVFGEYECPPVAESTVLTHHAGMHRCELRTLAILMPLTVLIVVFSVLSKYFGAVACGLLALPLAWISLHFLPWILVGKTSQQQWQCWFLIFLIWAIFHTHVGGLVGFFAYLWIAFSVMSGGGSLMIGWHKCLALKGDWGIYVRLCGLLGVHGVALAVGYRLGWAAGLGVGAIIAAITSWCILNPSSQLLGCVYRSIAEPGILITIDDGPDPHDTPILLDLLDRYQTKAVFFMIGEKVAQFPELAREVLRRGHEIGNHTMTHPQASFWAAGPMRTRREIESCQQIIEQVTGVKPRWFRAPVGHRNLFTHPITSELGLRVMGWNRRCYDALEKDPSKALKRIAQHLSGGDIVLLHEATPIASAVVAGVLAAEISN